MKISRSNHRSRRGFSVIEVLVVISVLTILSGMTWNVVNTSDRIPRERGIWRDIERITIAARLYRMERGSLPPNIETLESVGYVGKFIPPGGLEYGYVDDTTKYVVFAGSDGTDPASVYIDYFGNPILIDVLK